MTTQTDDQKPVDIDASTVAKLNAETVKLHAETAKLIAEAKKLSRESIWYPFLASSGVIGASAAATMFLAKYYGVIG